MGQQGKFTEICGYIKGMPDVKRKRRVPLFVLAAVAFMTVAYAGWTHLRSPESAASPDSYRVWIALLKGFSGDVVYVGSDDTHAYFRLGTIFWSYYKVPACAVHLPEKMSIDSATPYVVRLRVENGWIVKFVQTCKDFEGYAPGELERA